MEDWDVQYLSSVDIYSSLLFVQGEGEKQKVKKIIYMLK